MDRVVLPCGMARLPGSRGAVPRARLLPYLRLYLPRPGVAFESNSIGNIVSAVLGRGLGIALFASPEAQEPVYGFSMGVLSSLMEFDSWLGDPVHLEDIARAGPSAKGTRTGLQKVQMPPGHQIFLGAPSNTFFPSYMARALFRHLHEGWRSRSHGLRCLLI